MKTITLSLPGTTASVKHYIPVPTQCRVVGMTAVVNTTQTAGTALVLAGKKAATNKILSANLGTTGANGIGNVAKATVVEAATAAEKAQLFDNTTPVELDVQLVVAGQVVVTLFVDEYGITQFEG